MEVWIGLFFLGLGVGLYGTMIGAGGGFVLVPLLLLIYGKEYGDRAPDVVTAISLAVVCVNAASGTIAYARMHRVNYRAGVAFALATLPGAVLGAVLIEYLHQHVFSIIMGSLLVLVAVLLSIRPRAVKPNGANNSPLEIPPSRHSWPDQPFNMPLGTAISGAVGFLASILGVGGGIIHVPAMSYVLRFPVHVATATSHFVLVFTALAGTIVHIVDGDLSGTWGRVIPLALGVIPGAQFGAYLARKIHGMWILRLLGVALGLVGLRLLWKAWAG